jgi:acyl-CoA thioester hydrolase
MAGVQQNITYRRELMAGDIVEVTSVVLEVREKSVRFMHEMRNAETGEVAATCEITAIHLDRQARKSTAFGATIRRTAMSQLAVAEAAGA